MWLFGPDHNITEVGTMNLFFVWKKKDGSGIEVVTAPLDRGDILPGEKKLFSCMRLITLLTRCGMCPWFNRCDQTFSS